MLFWIHCGGWDIEVGGLLAVFGKKVDRDLLWYQVDEG